MLFLFDYEGFRIYLIYIIFQIYTQQQRSSFTYLFRGQQHIILRTCIFLPAYDGFPIPSCRFVSQNPNLLIPSIGIFSLSTPGWFNTTWIVLLLLTRNDNRVFIFHRSQLYRDKYIRFSSDTIYLSSFIYRYRYVFLRR